MFNIILNILILILSITFFTIIISLINSSTESIILTKFGPNIRFFFSIIGTPIHELSHAIMCIFFRHTIVDVKLLNLDTNSNIAGYVYHKYDNNNLYQKIGNFFIGIAPIYIGFAILCIIYIHLMQSPKELSFWIGLLLCQHILIHMRCSKEDFKNSLSGMIAFIFSLIIIALINPNIIVYLNKMLFKYGFLTILISGINFLFFFLIKNKKW